jgi:hypothetical protein
VSQALDYLRRIVEGFVGARLDHLALYPATVVAQRADGTLDLQPDGARVPPCAGVPIRHGLPGITVTVPAGGRVLLGYAGGNPDLPYASLWESGSVTTITVNSGTRKAARDGENVAASAEMTAWIAAVSALLNAPGVPVVGAPGAVTPPTTLGTVDGGASEVLVP